MLKHKPTDPEEIARINACLTELRMLVSKMRRDKEIGVYIGCVTDDIAMLEDVLKYGAFDGKVPSVNERSRPIFVKHQLEDRMHPPPQRRNRRSRG